MSSNVIDVSFGQGDRATKPGQHQLVIEFNDDGEYELHVSEEVKDPRRILAVLVCMAQSFAEQEFGVEATDARA